MANRTYAAGIMGYGGLFSAVRNAWGNRFSGVRCFIMLMERDEKLELHVTRDARSGDDHVTLTRHNWRTGNRATLYDGKFMGGTPTKKRHPRD